MANQSTYARQSQAISDIQKIAAHTAGDKQKLIDELMQPIEIRLGMGQLLADDFIYSLKHTIKQAQGK